jgi:3beta-hydroxy-delta5-steroid dehydrogenase/steroid delta-isomerase
VCASARWHLGPGSRRDDDRRVRGELAKGAFKATIGNGATPLDNTHVENVVDAQLLAAKALRSEGHRRAGKAYFVTDDERFDAMAWFQPIVEGLGHPFPKVRVPGALMKKVAAALERAHHFGAPPPMITVRSIRNLTEGAHFSIARARAGSSATRRGMRRAHIDRTSCRSSHVSKMACRKGAA